MKEFNGGAVPRKESLLPEILFFIFVAIFIWATTGWFFGILVSASGHGNAAGGIFVSWAVSFVIVLAVLMNADE